VLVVLVAGLVGAVDAFDTMDVRWLQESIKMMLKFH
jgi:hypothetical protein